MNRVWKKGFTMLMTGILAGVLFAGCGAKKADSPEGAVKEFLEASKELDFDKMAQYTTESTWDDQVEEMMTIDAWKNFMEITAPKMTYEIQTVENDTVTVKIKYFDGTEVYTAAMNEYFTQAMAMMSEEENVDEDAIVDLLDDILKEKTKDMEETYAEKTMNFVCDEDSGYRIANVDQDFAAILTANLTAIADTLGQDMVTE